MKLTKLRNGLIVLVGVLIVIAGILLWQQGRFSPPEADTSVLTVGTPNPSGESNGSGHAADARNGAAALQHLEAPLLEQDENLRRWPGESLLSADLTGGAPRLADFKGRPYGEEALKGAVIFLDYGHGGVDAGTVYPTRPPHELLEKTLNIEIGRILKKSWSNWVRRWLKSARMTPGFRFMSAVRLSVSIWSIDPWKPYKRAP